MSTASREIATSWTRAFKFLVGVIFVFVLAYCVSLGFKVYWHSQPTKTQQECTDGTWYDWPSTVTTDQLLAACVGHGGADPNGR